MCRSKGGWVRWGRKGEEGRMRAEVGVSGSSTGRVGKQVLMSEESGGVGAGV